MFESCLQKQKLILEEFCDCANPQQRYEKIIALGRAQTPLRPAERTPDNLIPGCQSTMYMHTRLESGHFFFQTEADALISAGLGMLLTRVYSGESLETILKCPPCHLQKLGIYESLSQSRIGGLASIHHKMKQKALELYTKQRPPLCSSQQAG